MRRHGTEAAGGKAKIVSEDELERRQRGSGKRRREEEEEGTVEVTEEVDDEARGRPVLRATPEHLRKLSKRKLVRLARDARLIVKASPLASTSQVRLALEPFLPTGKMLAKVEREAKAAKRQTRQKGKVAPKSKYGASKFEGGKEVSVYGVGGPTDTDFLQEAESTLKEDPDFASLSTKEREEELDGLARDLSDHYFRMVLIGEITPDGKSVASFTPGRPNLENALEEKELFASADPGFARQGEEEEGDGDVKEDEEKWAAAEERDYSIYTKEELNDLLHRAAGDGSVSGISSLVSAGASVFSRGKVARGWTPLMSAAFQGHCNATRRLLDLGANVSARTAHLLNPLHLAVAGRGDPATIQVLVEFGADLEAEADGNWTALHFAAYFTRARAMLRLMELGADASAETGLELDPAALARDVGLNHTALAMVEMSRRKREGLLEERRRAAPRRPSSPQPPDRDDLPSEESGSSEDLSAREILAQTPHRSFWEEDDGDAELERIVEDFPSSEEAGSA